MLRRVDLATQPNRAKPTVKGLSRIKFSGLCEPKDLRKCGCLPVTVRLFLR